MKKRKCFFSLIVFLIVLSLIVFAVGCQQAEKVAEEKTEVKAVEFPTKNITLVVPVVPGGGFDRCARIFAPYFEKYLPRKVTVVVENVPGASWVIGIDKVYRAKPDGHTIGIFNIPGNVVTQLVMDVKFDLNKFTWVGRIAEDIYVMAISPSSTHRTVDELIKAEKVKIATDGLASTSGLGVLITTDRMGINQHFILHDGSTESILAAVRGDAELVQYPYGSLKPYIKDSNELIPLIVFADNRLPDLPDVPTIVELGYPELLDVVKLQRLIATTPGVPEDVAQILNDAFLQTMNDPEFQHKLKEAKIDLAATGAEEAAKIIKNAVEQFTAYKPLLLEHVK